MVSFNHSTVVLTILSVTGRAKSCVFGFRSSVFGSLGIVKRHFDVGVACWLPRLSFCVHSQVFQWKRSKPTTVKAHNLQKLIFKSQLLSLKPTIATQTNHSNLCCFARSRSIVLGSRRYWQWVCAAVEISFLHIIHQQPVIYRAQVEEGVLFQWFRVGKFAFGWFFSTEQGKSTHSREFQHHGEVY